MRAIPQAAIDLVRDQEETHLFAYDDAFYPPRAAVAADQIQGTLTAGTGHTGPDVAVGMVVTPELDAAWLMGDLGTAAERIFKLINGVTDLLTDNQWAALLDFAFNLGANPSWTIWKRLKAKQFEQVPLEMAKFVNAGGKKLQGLVNRRNAEIALWATGEPGTDTTPIPSSITRQPGTTPPTPSDPVKPGRSKSLIAGAIGAAAAVGPAVDSCTHALAPYADHSPLIERTVGILFTIAGIAAGVSWFYAYINKRNARN